MTLTNQVDHFLWQKSGEIVQLPFLKRVLDTIVILSNFLNYENIKIFKGFALHCDIIILSLSSLSD